MTGLVKPVLPEADPDYRGQAVVVTGVGRSGHGGDFVARAFASRGASVECVGRSDAVEERVRELRAAGYAAVASIADLSVPEQAAEVAHAVSARNDGRVSAVAALAGGFEKSGDVADSDPAIIERQLSANLLTAINTARAFARPVRAAGGAFVFASSTAASAGGRSAGIVGYAGAKAGVEQLVRAFAEEERHHGVRVNAVAPSSLRTPGNLDLMGESPDYVGLDEFAAAILLLCSPACRRVSGQVIWLA